MKGHPHHKMASKHSKDGHIAHMGESHYEKKVEPVEYQDSRYASEMGACEEQKKQVDGLASYIKKNKMKYD